MKLLMAVVQDTDSRTVIDALVEKGFRVTQATSSGGWLRKGAATLMVGLEDARLDEALNTIRKIFPRTEQPQPIKAQVFVIKNTSFLQI